MSNNNKTPSEVVRLNIKLDYIANPDLFDKTASEVAVKILGSGRAKDTTKPTQIRNFYDYVLELNDKAQAQPFNEILPFVKMLNSKVAYSKSRGHSNEYFVQMIKECVEQVKTKEKLNVFKLFFEAVLGFCKK